MSIHYLPPGATRVLCLAVCDPEHEMTFKVDLVTCDECKRLLDAPTYRAPREVNESARHDDPVEHPPHYNTGKIEVIAFIDDQQLGFSLGNALKYICRAPHKGRELEDLKKAAWYLAHEIARLERGS